MNLTISIFLIFISYFPSFYRRKENSNNFNFNLKKKKKEKKDSILVENHHGIESCVGLTDPIEWKIEQGRKCVIISCIFIGEMETGNGDRSGENEMAGQ